MNLTESMRRDWDERARKDAFHYIASWRKDWNPESFFQSGEEDYQRLVAPVFDQFHWEPKGKSILELGCGAGRMTRSFSRRFSQVYAFDISTEMLGHAQALLPQATNVKWTLGNGSDLAGLTDQTVDFAFSYIVLQHMPDPTFALRYIREMIRVLKPGGIFLFQYNGTKQATMNWKGRLAWGAVDAFWALNLRRVSQVVARLLGFDPETAGKSWRGASLRTGKVVETLRVAGGIAVEITGDQTPMAWCRGKRAANVAPNASE